jgi:hypothetical protein
MITQEQLIKKVHKASEGKYHAFHDRTTRLAKFYRQVTTGQQQGELVVSYKPSETQQQKEQRLEIYKSKTQSTISVIMSQFAVVKGTPRIADSVAYAADENSQVIANKAKLNAIISRFYGKQTLQQYLEEKETQYALLDPNAWLVISQVQTESGLEIQPFIFASENVIDYSEKGGITEFFIGRYYNTKQASYRAYTKGLELVFIPNTEGEIKPETEPIQSINIGSVTYSIYAYPNTLSHTPAMRFGYIPDNATNGETYTGIVEAASEELRDIINQKSEYDLSLALHTFLKKYQYVDRCDYRDSEQPHIRCDSGYLAPSGGVCPSCKGKGFKMHATSQDAILVSKPKSDDEKEPVKLSELVHYETMPFDIVNHQAQRVAELEKSIPNTIFGVDISARITGNKTATEISNFYDSVYQVITPFAEKISQLYIFCVTVIAEYFGIGENLVVNHRYPKSFKMETLADLQTLLKSAKDSGASSEIIWGYEQRILELQNKDSPQQIEMAKTMHRVKPFKSLSENERTLALSMLPENDYFRVLYMYLDVIFSSIKQQRPDFLLLTPENQDKLIDAEVKKLQAQLKPVTPTLETPAV